VVEEQLNVGKREVEGGTVWVRTRVTERPVQEQINLRKEHVTVDRYPVDRPADASDLTAFQEATSEVQERHEEAVVSKTAKVVEEVVVGKEATEHIETVRMWKLKVRRQPAAARAAAATMKPASAPITTQNMPAAVTRGKATARLTAIGMTWRLTGVIRIRVGIGWKRCPESLGREPSQHLGTIPGCGGNAWEQVRGRR
jgi:uncharacterized protein (TIGR02271 family)